MEEKNVVSVYLIGNVKLAMDSDGKIYTWGKNNSVMYGNGTGEAVTTPTCINTGELENIQFSKVTYNSYKYQITAEDTNGKIWKWGRNTNGDIALGVTGDVLSPMCITDYYENLGINPDEVRITYINNVNIGIDKDGKVWSWGENTNYSGTGVTEGTNELPVCLSKDSESINLKDGNIKFADTSEYVYALTQDGIAWAWGGDVLTPTKLNDCEQLKNKVIQEIGHLEIEEEAYLYVLTEDKLIYTISLKNGITIENIENKKEIIETHPGGGSRQFRVVKNANYTK